MKKRIYWVTFFIHVTTYTFLSFFVYADSLPKGEEFKPSESLETLTKLKEKNSLTARDKLNLACAYFWLGHLQNTIAILDPKNSDEFIDEIDNLRDSLKRQHFLNEDELEDWEKKSPKERAQASLYLGYTYLSLGYESEAYKNFIDAFRFDSDLEFDNNALRYDYLEGIITDAKIAAQMVALNLFVAVDISKSVSQSEKEKIKELQLDVCNKLKSEADHVLFFPFADMSSRPPFPDSSPSSNSIVKDSDLRTAVSTDFVKLFGKLHESIQSHNDTVIDPARRTAILIISDGEHSVPGNEGGGEARIPEEVSEELENFLNTYGDIPIVIITVDRTGKDGSYYAAKWTEEFDTYSVKKNKKSFYYDSESKEKNLEKIFDTIAPHRSETFVIRNPKTENQSSLFNDDNHTLELLIQNPQQRARIEVTGKPNWKVESRLFDSNWKEDSAKFTTIGPGEHPKSVNITCLNMNEVIPAFQRPKPLIFTLTFHLHPEQGMGEKKPDIGKVSLLFQNEKPTLEITKRFGHKVILVPDERRYLKFRANIKSSYPLFEQFIPLMVKISKNRCFTTKGGTINPSTAIIFLETRGQIGRHEFNLPIVTEPVDGLLGRQFNNDVTIDFSTNDNITEYNTNDNITEYNINNQVKKINFRVVRWGFYFLYRLNWYLFFVCLVILICAAFYPFLDDRMHTITRISGEGFTVSGNTIYDSKGKQILRLRQKWWFVTFEFAEISLKSVKLFWQRSGKEKAGEDEKIGLLAHKHRMKLRGAYRIILAEHGKTENTFKIDSNYRLKTWHRRWQWIWISLGSCATILGGVWVYVSLPLSPLLASVVFLFLICIIVHFLHERRKSRGNSDSHLLGDFGGLGRNVGIVDAIVSLIEKIIQFLPM